MVRCAVSEPRLDISGWSDDHRQVLAQLAKLDGSVASAICLLTGLTRVELDRLGGVEEPTPRVPRQPDIGGFCDDCGHLAARHDTDGCSGIKRACRCKVMQWDGYKWPRPWLPAPEGLRSE